MNWTKIQNQAETCVQTEIQRYRSIREADDAREQDQQAENAFENLLKPQISKLVYKAARSIGVIPSFRIRVKPLVNHINKTAQPFVEISFAGKCGRFEIEGCVNSDQDIYLLIERFKKTLAINRT